MSRVAWVLWGVALDVSIVLFAWTLVDVIS
jgi:hypothetical protein